MGFRNACHPCIIRRLRACGTVRWLPPSTQAQNMHARETTPQDLDVREIPRYTARQAAHYTRIPLTTMQYWVRGGTYTGGRFEAILERPDPNDRRLSFSNLTEAHVLRALRRRLKVEMKDVRAALRYARDEFGIDRLLLSKKMRAAPGRLMVERFGQLINAGVEGQLELQELLEAHLERLEWDEQGRVKRLFPLTREDVTQSPKVIVIDPAVAFGHPVIDGAGVSTAVIAQRFDCGESVAVLADDYRIEVTAVEEALRAEKAA